MEDFSTDFIFEFADRDARIGVIGIGQMGKEMVQILSRNLCGISCHEVVSGVHADHPESIVQLLSSIRDDDLVFILSGFENDHCSSTVSTVGQAARTSGVLTLGIAPVECMVRPGELRTAADTLFRVSARSMPMVKEPGLTFRKNSLTGYVMRHVVTAITNLINQRSLICVDFQDFAAIMRAGSLGKVGVGVATGPDKGRIATSFALDRLAAQGVTLNSAQGVLAIVQGSSLLAQNHYQEASKTIDDVSVAILKHVAQDANMIVGFITDEQLGGNVRVTVLVVSTEDMVEEC